MKQTVKGNPLNTCSGTNKQTNPQNWNPDSTLKKKNQLQMDFFI